MRESHISLPHEKQTGRTIVAVKGISDMVRRRLMTPRSCQKHNPTWRYQQVSVWYESARSSPSLCRREARSDEKDRRVTLIRRIRRLVAARRSYRRIHDRRKRCRIEWKSLGNPGLLGRAQRGAEPRPFRDIARDEIGGLERE
jgi:hypothetical protein